MRLSVLLLLAAAALPAQAGWLDALTRIGGKGVKGAALHGATSLDTAAAHIKSLPARSDVSALAATASHEGHWRFVNRAGETMTAATPDELARALNVLAPEAAKGRKLALYLTEDTVFAHRAQLKDLPATRELNVVIGRDAYPLQLHGEGATRKLVAEVHAGLVVELAERQLFDEALWQLARPLNRSNIRTVALAPGGPAAIPSAPRFEPLPPTPAGGGAGAPLRRALTDMVDPDRLRHSLSGIRGQTVLVTGRIDGERLVFKPASGPERSLLLRDLTAAAEAAEVNLVILRSSSPRQPGARNWLWQTVEVANLETAIGQGTVADFLAALGAEQGRMLVAVTRHGQLRTELQLTPARGLADASSPGVVSSTLNEILSEVTAKVVLHGVSAHLRSAEREAELEQRLIPGIPSHLQQAWLSGLFLGLLAWRIARGWFARLWPSEQAGEYGHASGYWAALAARGLAWWLVFLPLAGPLAFVVRVLQPLWNLIFRRHRPAM